MNSPASISTHVPNESVPSIAPLGNSRASRWESLQILFRSARYLVQTARPSRPFVVDFIVQRQTLTMYEPLRQTGFVTTVTMILSGLYALLAAFLVQEAVGQPPPVCERLPYRAAACAGLSEASGATNFAALLNKHPTSPHPAVARIAVPEGMATAYGTGTLVDVRDEFGLVVTNWHVVRDATGVVEVIFPSGFRSQARALKVDTDWDLAALVIWRPPIEPVKLAAHAPRQGDRLTIHGYGQGEYRIASGQCLQYYAPRVDYPHEMVELNVEARQGDSGGPIFNDRGELAGVLFGAGQGTTIGSFGGRVESFLATLAPDIGRPPDAEQSDALLAATSLPLPTRSNATRRAEDHAQGEPGQDCYVGAATETMPDSRPDAHTPEEDPSSELANDWPDSPWSTGPDNSSESEFQSWSAASTASLSAAPDGNWPLSDEIGSRSVILDRTISLLALVGLYTICIHIVRLVT